MYRAKLGDNGEASTKTVDLLEAAKRFLNLEAAPSFIVCSKEYSSELVYYKCKLLISALARFT